MPLFRAWFSGLLVQEKGIPQIVEISNFSLGQGIDFVCSVWGRVGISGGQSGTRYQNSPKCWSGRGLGPPGGYSLYSDDGDDRRIF